MSVYTRVERDQLEAFLRQFSVGDLIEYSGISAGIENTNYFVTTTQGRFVLTLFEQLGADELPFFLNLMAHLAEHDVPTAHPLPRNQDGYLGELCAKPAALVQRLQGSTLEQPQPAHCQAIGAALAKLHLAGQHYPAQRANPRGPAWWQHAAQRLAGKLEADEVQRLQAELDFQRAHRHDALPRGIIHADLFRDNALFAGEHLCGIIDLYYACSDALLYDVAVTVNDWCVTEARTLDAERATALLTAYAQVRPFTRDERAAWPVMLRAAALRFWLSRLIDLHFPREGELTHTKDPNAFARLLAAHQQGVAELPQ